MVSHEFSSEDEIDILFTISNRLTQAYSPAEWLEAISDYARDNGANCGLMFYMNAEMPSRADLVELVADWTRGAPPIEPRSQFELSPNALARVMGVTPVRPILIPDVLMSDLVDAPTQHQFGLLDVRSAAILPFNIKDRRVGFCLFGWREAHLFDEQDQWIYTAMLRLGGPVIDSMRLSEQAQRRATDLQIAKAEIDLLYEASGKVTGASTPAQVLEAISSYPRAAGATSGVLLYIDEALGGLPPARSTVVAQWTPLTIRDRLGEHIILDEHPLNQIWMAFADRPTMIQDVEDDPRVDPITLEFFRGLKLRGTVILPLNNKGRWVGMVAFNWDQPRAFDERDQRVYTGLIQQAGPVIDAMRLLQESRDRASRAELLLRVSTALSQATSEAEILAAVALYAGEQNARSLVLSYSNDEDPAHRPGLLPVAVWREGSTHAYDDASDAALAAAHERLLALWDGQVDQPFLVEDWLADARASVALRDADNAPARALALLPLHTAGRFRGMVTMAWAEPHHFNEQERYICNVLMQTVPSVVTTRRAYLAEEAARQETRLLYEAGEAINAATTFAEVTDAVGRLNISLHNIVLTVWENFNYEGARYSEVVGTAIASKQPIGERFFIESEYPAVRNMPARGLWVIEDVLNDPRLDPVSAASWADRGTQARIGVPLWINNRWTGNLAFLSPVPRTYTARDRRLVAGIGDLVSAAIERIRLQRESELGRRRAETLAHVNAALSQATDEWTILEAVALYADQLKPDFLSLNFVDVNADNHPATMTPVAVREHGSPAADHPTLGVVYDLSLFPSTRLWAAHPTEALMLGDVEQESEMDARIRAFLKALDYRALVIIPLYGSGRWAGNITIGWHQPREFSAGDRLIAEALIRTAGAVVSSRRAFLAAQTARRETEQRARELETVANVSAAATTLLSVTRLLNTVTSLTRTNFNLTHAHVFLLSDDGSALVLASAPEEDDALGLDYRISIRSGTCVVSASARSRQGVIFDEAASGCTPVLPETRSELSVPMIVGDTLIGVLDLHSDQPARFSKSDMAVMGTLADQVAVAVQNARLYAQAQELAVFEERNRLARELHDSVSQALYGIALGTRTARDLLDRDPKKVAEPLDYVLSLAEAGLTEMRALIFELRPESLKNEGLIAALMKQAASLQARHGVQVQTDLGDEPDVPMDVKEALYHIAREALHNTVKHARASRVTVCLDAHEQSLILNVTDNGVGFDTGGAFPGHLGLQSMRERVGRLGGAIDLESTKGLGTHIRVVVPLET